MCYISPIDAAGGGYSGAKQSEVYQLTFEIIQMNIVRKRRRWFIEGDGEGWIFNKQFLTKWEALLAMEVFRKGGRVSDYWAAKKEHPKRKMNAWRVRGQLQQALEEIRELGPTSEEIKEYGEQAGYGTVTYTRNARYYPPHLHDTWGRKWGGRVHIDIGSGGIHLMLDNVSAFDFIEFIRDRRKSHDSYANYRQSQQ